MWGILRPYWFIKKVVREAGRPGQTAQIRSVIPGFQWISRNFAFMLLIQLFRSTQAVRTMIINI